MMCCQRSLISKPNLFGAMLFLWFAAVLTSVGVLVLPIYLFVAAPCYFVFTVFIFSLRIPKSEQRIYAENVDGSGWF